VGPRALLRSSSAIWKWGQVKRKKNSNYKTLDFQGYHTQSLITMLKTSNETACNFEIFLTESIWSMTYSAIFWLASICNYCKLQNIYYNGGTW
jgi:hypothetical protein